MKKPLNLNGFVPLPHDPAYLVHADGRVASLKKTPTSLLSERRRRSAVNWRVRIGRTEVRVRDLAFIMHGTTQPFDDRADAWLDENYPNDWED